MTQSHRLSRFLESTGSNLRASGVQCLKKSREILGCGLLNLRHSIALSYNNT